jgi:hypothetical protein
MRTRIRLVGIFLLAAVIAACTGSTPAPSPTPSAIPSPSHQPSGVTTLRGLPVAPARCPQSLDALIPIANAEYRLAVRPIVNVTALILCHFPGTHRAKDATVHASDSTFQSAVTLLSRPDLPRATTPCAAVAGQGRVVILAVTSNGTYLVRLPVGPCGHYLLPLPQPL